MASCSALPPRGRETGRRETGVVVLAVCTLLLCFACAETCVASSVSASSAASAATSTTAFLATSSWCSSVVSDASQRSYKTSKEARSNSATSQLHHRRAARP